MTPEGIYDEMFARHSWYFRKALVRANDKNGQKGIEYTLVYLERFFCNLLLDDGWDLRNRYLHISPSNEWKVQPNLKASETITPTSTRQVPDKLRVSNPNIISLVRLIGNSEMKVKEMMDSMGLKNRENFVDVYLSPAMAEGFVCMLYPDSPRSPKQRYLLTVKGRALYDAIKKEKK